MLFHWEVDSAWQYTKFSRNLEQSHWPWAEACEIAKYCDIAWTIDGMVMSRRFWHKHSTKEYQEFGVLNEDKECMSFQNTYM